MLWQVSSDCCALGLAGQLSAEPMQSLATSFHQMFMLGFFGRGTGADPTSMERPNDSELVLPPQILYRLHWRTSTSQSACCKLQKEENHQQQRLRYHRSGGLRCAANP